MVANESISGLHLKRVKCVVVNLGRGSDEALKERIAEEIPAWADFPVSGGGKYLGTWLGPSASEFRWVGPVGKFKEKGGGHSVFGICAFSVWAALQGLCGFGAIVPHAISSSSF